MHETWNLDGKHSLWNPVCLPELPDSYLFPKDVFFLLHCFFLLLDKAGLLEYPPPLLFKLAAEGKHTGSVEPGEKFCFCAFEHLKTVEVSCSEE